MSSVDERKGITFQDLVPVLFFFQMVVRNLWNRQSYERSVGVNVEVLVSFKLEKWVSLAQKWWNSKELRIEILD